MKTIVCEECGREVPWASSYLVPKVGAGFCCEPCYVERYAEDGMRVTAEAFADYARGRA